MDVEKWSEATRPLVTAIVVTTFCAMALYLGWVHAEKMSSDQVLTVLVAFVGFATTICQYWFKEKGDQRANDQMVNTMKALGAGSANGGTGTQAK